MSDVVLDEPVYSTDLDANEVQEGATAGPGEVDAPDDLGVEAVLADLLGSPAESESAAVETAPDTTGLKSALEATYTIEPPAPTPVPSVAIAESVVGVDNRIRITNTDTYPWSAHASLLITARDGTLWLGTAFFIGPRVLATAGHNVFIHSPIAARQGWVRSVRVMPGRNGNELPFGSATTSRYASVTGWTVNGPNPDYDYAVIILDEDDDLGAQTGTLGFGSYSDSTLRSLYVNLSGYPSDRGSGREQWYMGGRIEDLSNRQIFYEIDTFGGQSGSAVYRITDGQRYAVGIHAYGVGSRPYNAATRITRPVFDNLLAWKNDNT